MARRITPAAGQPGGAAHARAIFTAEDVSIIHSLSAKGWVQREIAEYMTARLVAQGRRRRYHPIRHTMIGKILRGENYAHD